MSRTAVMDREGKIVKHKKPKRVTTFETIRILLEQNSFEPISLGDFEVIAVPSSGEPGSPPFYLVQHSKSIADLWICYCKDQRFRGVPGHECEHIEDAQKMKGMK